MPPLLPDLVPRWKLQTGLAVLRQADSLYVCSGDADAAAQFDALAARFGARPIFCINDTSDDAAADAPELLRIGATLAALLPTPSRFERAAL